MATQLKVENFFDTVLSNLSVPWSGDITLTLGQIPSYSRGIVIISPDNPSQREVCYFHNAVGNTIYITGTNRINPKTHAKNEVVRMNDVAEYFNYLSNNTSQAFYVERTSDTTINVFGGDIMINDIAYTLNDTQFTLTADGTYYIGLDTTSGTIVMMQSIVAWFIVRSTLVKIGTTINVVYKKIDMTAVNLAWLGGVNNITINTTFLTGEIKNWATKNIPSGWLICDGAAYSRTLFPDLFAVLINNIGTPTISIATPAVVSFTSHWLSIGDRIYFTTTGALPTGLAINTIYYVIATWFTANSFQISATSGWSAVDTSGTQSWVHSFFYCPYGLGDWTTTFNVPDMRGKVIAGTDSTQSEFLSSWFTGGEKSHILTVPEIPGHTHTVTRDWWSGAGWNVSWWNGFAAWTSTSSSTGGWLWHNNLQPYVSMNFIIKT